MEEAEKDPRVHTEEMQDMKGMHLSLASASPVPGSVSQDSLVNEVGPFAYH